MVKKAKVLIAIFSQAKYLFLYALLIFTLLLFRNPFSQRTLIPNLEPYPDTIHYLTPARSLVMGGPFRIIREGRIANPGVSPLYSIVVLPFYLINTDVRMFYFANIFLSLVSLILFYLILRRISGNRWVVGFTLFLYVTNFFIYWYPQWAMAENLVQPIYLLGLLLLLTKVNTRNLLLAGFVSVSLYATKYANIPITVTYCLLYLGKIIWESRGKIFLVKRLGVYILCLFTFMSCLILYTSSINGPNPFLIVLRLIRGFFSQGSVTGALSAGQATGSWISFSYFKVDFPQYVYALIGKSARFLWDFTPMVPVWVGIVGLSGLVMGCFVPRETRYLSLSMIVLLSSEIIFMSTFYAVDMRYISFAIPTLLLGFAIFMSNLGVLLSKKKAHFVFILIIFASFGYYFFTNAIRIKSQIVINIKYAETPWYYISVLKLNDYFTKDKFLGDKIPYVISPMPPYYIDFYSNGNYRLLPLSTAQEFRNGMETVWGNYDYSDLPIVYRGLLQKGEKLYVSTYGLGNEAYLHAAFENLYKDFKLTEVQNECYTQCKIYKLELKNGKSI